MIAILVGVLACRRKRLSHAGMMVPAGYEKGASR